MNLEQDQSISSTIANVISVSTNEGDKSLRQIAYYSGVSYSYVRRLAKLEIQDNKLDPIKLFQVVKFIKDSDFAYEILSLNQEWAKKLKNWLGYDKPLAKKSIEKADLEKIILSNDQTILAFILASNLNGTNKNELKEIGGNPLLKAVDFLVEQNILKILDKTITSTVSNHEKGEFFTFSREAYKKVITILVKYYDVTHAGYSRNYIFVGTERLSHEFISKLQEKVSELREWYSIESKKVSNKGDNPFFFSMLMDSFTDELTHDKKVLQ